MLKRLLPVALLLAPCIGFAQQSDEIPIFRVTSTRVVIEFLAIDKRSGQFVNDLKLDEIELNLDGKKQEIDVLFQPQDVRASAAAGTAPQQGASQQQAGEPAQPGAAADAPSRTVILLDARALDAGNFGFSVNAVRKFIQQSLDANHFVMVAAVDRQLKVLQQFTRDRQALLEAVGKLRPATVVNRLDSLGLARNPDPGYIDLLREQMYYLRESMRLLSYSLSALPGRKHIVFFSDGYPLNPVQDMETAGRMRASRLSTAERQAVSRDLATAKNPAVMETVQELVSLANNFGIAYYTIDARGLVGVPGLDATVGPDKGISLSGQKPTTDPDVVTRGGGVSQADALENLQVFGLTAINDLQNAPNFLVALAAGTNGSTFANKNDLGTVLRASTAEQQQVYLASFVPSNPGRKNRFRKVEVKASRPDVLVRHQIGYLETPDEQLSDNRMALALARPDLFQNLTAVIQIQPGNKTSAHVGMLGAQVATRPSPGGKKRQFEVVVVAQVYDEKGEAVYKKPPLSKEFKMDITPEQYQSLVQQNLVAPLELSLASGSYSLVVAVEDRVSGMLGVGSQEFTVP